MTDTKTKTYQWIKGDRSGDVVQVAESQPDAKWLYFQDGTRINPSLVNEFLFEIHDASQVLSFSPALTPEQPKPVEVTADKSQPVTTKTVMGSMIEKMSKKNVVQIPINININIPTPSIYVMLSEGMEEEDLNEEIMQVALSQLEIDKLQDYIKEHISNFLNTYYGK